MQSAVLFTSLPSLFLPLLFSTSNVAHLCLWSSCCSWYNHLDPAIKRGPWEEDEDRKIITLQHHLGNKWADIAMQIPGR